MAVPLAAAAQKVTFGNAENQRIPASVFVLHQGAHQNHSDRQSIVHFQACTQSSIRTALCGGNSVTA
ncbi:hypothetical protein E1180_18075 [Roseibium denhamense]|uniref:hypothetical protein n=1 Tax=Roseibium denhamense TaxID=76305 RepID=UPI0012BD22A2|nr:hypothetical protein [Roseibium denhamense]MTI07414.1 hypothetical protein [Roseibium denhamense]